VILGREQSADVSVEDEVGTVSALDRFVHFRIDAVDQVPETVADLLLPVGQSRYLPVNSWVTVVARTRGHDISVSRRLGGHSGTLAQPSALPIVCGTPGHDSGRRVQGAAS
jgi:hypothetical protein